MQFADPAQPTIHYRQDRSVQGFSSGQSSTASSHFPAGVEERADEPGEGFFLLFKKIKRKSAASAAVPSPRVPASVSSWTRAASEDLGSADEPATQQDEDEELLFEEDPSGWFVSIAASRRPRYWHRSSRRSLWHLPPGASSRRRKGRKRGR